MPHFAATLDEKLKSPPFLIAVSPRARKNSLQKEPKQELRSMNCHSQLIQSLTQTAGADNLNSKTFECLIIQIMKKDVNHASVQFSLSQFGTRIAWQSKRTNTQTSL